VFLENRFICTLEPKWISGIVGSIGNSSPSVIFMEHYNGKLMKEKHA
jgi:hypothetical protein